MTRCTEKGFTLFEIVLSLVLTGILAAVVGTGVVSGFNIFAAARDNTHITQKTNLALTRLTRELREVTNVVTVDSTAPYLIYQHANTTSAIALDGDTIKLYSNVAVATMNAAYIAANGDVLIDDVMAFSLSYWNGASAWQTAPALDPIRELSAIGFQFDMGRDTLGARTTTFGNMVHLRNNNNYGGAILAVTPPTPPTLGNYPCFIGAAGQGIGSPRGAIFASLFLLLPLFSVRRRRKSAPPRRASYCGANSRGAALIAVIGVLVVFSALAIIMLPLVTTSQYTQLGQDSASKTYFLAESGYRYAASQYLNAISETAKNAEFENMHAQTFTLAGDAGSFNLTVFPFFGYVQSDPSGTNTLTIRMPGGLTAALDNAAFAGGGRLQIGRTFFSYTGANTTSPPNITFTMAAAMPSVPVNTDVFFAASTAANVQNVVQGGTINMAGGSTRTFPLLNGEVVINENVYAYEQNNISGNQLIGISDPEVANMPALNLAANTDVVLSKYVDLVSVGSYGSGHLASQRQITYHVPLPNTQYSQERQIYYDQFDDLDAWTPIWGGQVVQEIDGDNALRLTNPQWVMNLPRVSLTALDWTETPIDLEQIHQSADFFLSYDAQVKIGYVETPLPQEPVGREFTPAGSAIPTYFGAGMNFRLDSTDASHNTYGLSFLRGQNAEPHDRLDDNIVPVLEVPIIVLWQQTGGSNRTWLAWEQIGDLELEGNDAEGGNAGWTADGLWHITSSDFTNGASGWYYGQEGSFDYDTGASNAGELISPEIDLDVCDYEYVILSFQSRHATEATVSPDDFDLKSIGIRTFEAGSWSGWTELDRIEGASSGWVKHEIDISAYLGKRIQIRFYFDTNGPLNNGPQASGYEGWYLDEILVGAYWPLQEATLALRLQEAPSLRFTNGGPYVLRPGDAIYQAAASAVVDADPVITGGSWAGGSAAGHLLLKNVSGSFILDQAFSVIGGGQVGTVREVRARDNFMRVYYGSPAGCGTANATPLDNEKLANPRDPAELLWPPEEGEPYTAADDAYTLIQWDTDKINTAVTSFSRLNTTYLRSNESALVTPSSLLGRTRPEIGLHAMGRGAQNVYFDDFGLSVIFNDTPADVTAPIQE